MTDELNYINKQKELYTKFVNESDSNIKSLIEKEMMSERMLWAMRPRNPLPFKIEGSASVEKIDGLSAQIEVNSNVKPNNPKWVLSIPKITPENIEKLTSMKSSGTDKPINIKEFFKGKALQDLCNVLNLTLQNHTKVAAEKSGLTVSQTVDDTTLHSELSRKDGLPLTADDMNNYMNVSKSELIGISAEQINQEIESMENKSVLLPAVSTSTPSTYQPLLTLPLSAPKRTTPLQGEKEPDVQTDLRTKM